MDIVKPSIIDNDNLDANEGIVFEARLVEQVFITLIFNVNNIPLKCCLDFSHTLKDVLLKVVVEPRSVGAWVQLLLLPRCTLQVVKPYNRKDR